MAIDTNALINRSQKPARLDSLQVYRGGAAVLVVLYHITVYMRESFDFTYLGNLFSFGFAGVDFFFVLSGFIIFYTNYRDIGHPQKVKRYLTKRLIRIYPIYWGVLTFKVLLLVAMPGIAKSHETDFLVILKSYFLFPQQNLPVIGVAWTLSYEILFYLLFAFAMWFGWRWMLRLAFVWTAGILVFFLLQITGIFSSQGLWLGFLFSESNLEFILGCISAYIILNIRVPQNGKFVISGVILFLLSSIFVIRGGIVPSFTLFFGLPSFLIVLGSVAYEQKRKLRFPAWLVFLGDASYSIYLTHAVFVNAFMLIARQFDLAALTGPMVLATITSIVAVIGGCMVYVVLEKPLLVFLQDKFLHRPGASFAVDSKLLSVQAHQNPAQADEAS